jgi:ubiquinone/menaquinone biosynthesis C-methylase UbiE
MKDPEYERKVQEQVAQYQNVENIHDLPQIFHYWSNTYLSARVRNVLGVSRMEEFYASYLLEAAAPGSAPKFISIGAGDCSMEVNVAREMIARGHTDFTFDCLELSSHLLERGKKAAADAGLSERFRFIESDINSWEIRDRYNGVMVHHALHHFVELELLFEKIRQCLTPQGVFVTCDMIGRNGHMRWPEVLAVLEPLWAFMPHHYRYNHQHRAYHEKFLNWDCSTEGFEGIRAQDILPLLVKSFGFKKFFAFGGLPDVFVDRGYGPNLDINKPEDIAFIDFIELVNGQLIDSGYLKPTQCFAVMCLDHDAKTAVHKHWTPKFCVRDPQLPFPAQ